MEVHNGTEVCELVGIFLLDKISVKYDENSISLYRNNGLSVFKACVHYLLSNFYFSPNDSLLKTMKNVFYFI